MTNYQRAVLTANEKTLIECDKAPESVKLIPLFATKIDRVREIVNEINALAPQQAENLKGITSEKNSLLQTVADLSVDFAGAIHAYAEEEKNTQLQTKMDLTRSDFNGKNQTKILLNIDLVLAQIPNVPLAAFLHCGITEEEIKDYQEQTATLKPMLTAKEIATIDQSGVTDRINNLFDELSTIKHKSIKRLITQYSRKDPEFYFKLKAAMVVQYRSTASKSNKKTEDTTPAS